MNELYQKLKESSKGFDKLILKSINPNVLAYKKLIYFELRYLM